MDEGKIYVIRKSWLAKYLMQKGNDGIHMYEPDGRSCWAFIATQKFVKDYMAYFEEVEALGRK